MVTGLDCPTELTNQKDIVNMPGSGNYSASPSANFPETWERFDAPDF